VSSDLIEIASRNDALVKPDCCVQRGFHWDEAVLFPPGAHWKDGSAPVFWNGPVVKVISGLEPIFSEHP